MTIGQVKNILRKDNVNPTFGIIIVAIPIAIYLGLRAGKTPARRRAVMTWIARHRIKLFISLSLVLVVSVSLLFFARSTLEPASPEAMPSLVGDLAIVTAVLVLLGLLLLTMSLSLAGVDPDADEFASAAAPGELGERLLRRWLHRVRWRRWVGGLVGMLSGPTISLLFESVDLGFVYSGLVGLTLGSLSSELHHIRRGRDSARVADLTVRHISDYANSTDQKALGVCGAAAVATLAYALVSPASTGWAVGAVAVLLVAIAMQQRVALRRRPALTTELREADDLLRAIAISRGIARPAIALALASIGIALAPSDTAAAEIVETVVWIAALVVWWTNRGLGLKSIPLPAPTTSSGIGAATA